MDNYITSLQALSDESWPGLSIDEKLVVLQDIENEMAIRENRSPCRVTGEFIPSDDRGITLGYYNRDSRNITINTEQLDRASKYGNDFHVHLDTILHEGRHAYQHQAVMAEIEHNDKVQLAEWVENMKPGNYITFERNPRGYYLQPIEKDAREFAATNALLLGEERDASLRHGIVIGEVEGPRLSPDKDALEKSTAKNIEDILEAKRDDYRDKGMIDGPDMEMLIARERIKLQTEFEIPRLDTDEARKEFDYQMDEKEISRDPFQTARQEIDMQLGSKEAAHSHDDESQQNNEAGLQY